LKVKNPKHPVILVSFNKSYQVSIMQVVAMRSARMGQVVAFQGETIQTGCKAANVKFSVRQKLQFGQHIAVVGSNKVLGQWNPHESLALSWNEGDLWTAEARIETEDPVELKFVIVQPEDVVKWQPGDNVVLAVPEDASEVLVEAGSWESFEIVIKPVNKTETKVQTLVTEKVPEKKAKAISSVAAPDVARSNILRKASTPATTAASTSPTKATASSLSSTATPKLSIVEIEKMTIPKIKAIMVKMGLETTGKKSDLIARIRSYMQT
jgi:hypothetical protein